MPCTTDTIAGVMFVVIGSLFLLLLVAGLWQSVASRRWPMVEGEVIESYVEEEHDEGLNYRPKVRYRYRVDDQEYVSDVITSKAYWLVRGTAEKMAGRYPVGNRVQVYYNPRHPKQAVLEPGASLLIGLILIIPVVLLTIGIGLLLGIL